MGNEELIEKLERLTENQKRRVKSFEKQCTKGNAFGDIVGTLRQISEGSLELTKENPDYWERCKDDFIRSFAALDTYLNLLEINPQFAFEEFTSERYGDRDPARGKGFYLNYVRDAVRRVLG